MAYLTFDQAFEVARGHAQAGRLQEAELIYRQILAVQPNHPQALHHQALIASQLGRNDVAADLIRRAIATSPANPDYLTNLGVFLANQGQVDEAIACYRRALALNPDQPQAHNNLGNALRSKGELDQAIQCFQRAIRLDPLSFDPHYNLALAFCQKALPEQALASYQQSRSLNPDHAEVHYRLGAVLCELEQFDEAIASFRQAIAYRPNYLEALIDLGSVLVEQGMVDEAIAIFQRALACRPGFLPALYNLSDALMIRGQVNDAIALLSPGSAQRVPALPISSSAPNSPRYIGDRVVLLTCPQEVCQALESMGFAIASSTQGAFGRLLKAWDQQPAPAMEIVAPYMAELRNAAAMRGVICCIWTEGIPIRILEVIRRLAGPDVLEIQAVSTADALRQIESCAKPRPDTAGKIFAVCSIRNGPVDLLPHWLEHYCKLGVDRILLGLFEDITRENRHQIADFTAGRPCTYFNQTWNQTTEAAQEEQRRSALRQAGALPNTWILHSDLDELDEFPSPLSQIIAAADAQGIDAISGWVMDRVAADGSLPPIRPAPPSLFEQFPVACRLTARVLRGVTLKIMLAPFAMPVGAGHHFAHYSKLRPAPIGRPEQYIVHHFKWHAGVIPRLRWSLSQPNAPRAWKREAERFLKWLETNGGKIKLQDCNP